jgi:hypothetical protein
MYAFYAISQAAVAAAAVSRPATAAFFVNGFSAPDLLPCRVFNPFRHSESSAVLLDI